MSAPSFSRGSQATRGFSATVGKAFDVLGCFSAQTHELGATQQAERTGMDRSTIHRFLSTLWQLGVLAQDPETRRYRLGLRLLDYGYVLLNALEIRRVGMSHLHDLHLENMGTLSIGVPDRDEVVLVERTFGPWVATGGFEIGQRLPMHASATGLAVLANLPPGEIEAIVGRLELEPRTPRTVRSRGVLMARLEEIRRDGYALSDEELILGLRSLAVPIRDRTGYAVASVSLARRTSVTATVEELTREFFPKLQMAAVRISLALG